MGAAGLLRSLGVAGLALAALAYPAAWAIDRAAGVDVLPVAAADAASVAANRGLWEMNDRPRGEVASIYGTPAARTDRVVFADASKVLRPEEDPSLVLYLVGSGDHPLQAQTLWYFALPAAIGGAVCGAGLLLLGRRMAGRAAEVPAGASA